MDPKTAAKQFTELQKELIAVYYLMTGILARLPVPMNLQRLGENPSAVLRPLALAWDLLGDADLPPGITGQLRNMITAWCAAYEIMIIGNVFGPAPWRLRVIEDATARIRVAAAGTDQYLRADFQPEKLTDAEIDAITSVVTHYGTRGPRGPRK